MRGNANKQNANRQNANRQNADDASGGGRLASYNHALIVTTDSISGDRESVTVLIFSDSRATGGLA